MMQAPPFKMDLGFEYELDHIGMAVESLQDGFRFYEAIGFKDIEVEVVPTEKVRVGFIRLGNHASLELLEPTHPESAIRKFLDKKGPGVHHVCLRVKGIEGILKQLKASGLRLIDETSRPGAHGCRVAFIHPSATGGVLLELSERPGSH